MVFGKNQYKVADATIVKVVKEPMHRNTHGMTWVTAAIFIIGDMMGGGMIALPIALANAGLIPGVILIVLAAIFSGYTGIQLGDNWTMMQKRWPQYKSHCRRPYPEMAYRALGAKAKLLVAFCLCLTQFGIVTVLSLLASKNLSNFLNSFFSVQLNFCFVILIVGLAVWPFVMLKSPMDFCIKIEYHVINASFVDQCKKRKVAHGSLLNDTEKGKTLSFRSYRYYQFSISVNLIILLMSYLNIFSTGGHGAFPTIQHDMTKPFRFNRAVWASYIFILCVYLIVSITAFTVYGNSMADTVIPSLQINWLSQTVNIMITLHVLPTIVIVFSPLAQQFEEWVSVPQHFGWKRIVTRSLILFACVFTAESVPHFGVFLDLVGGSTITLMTMLLPSIFYLFLYASYRKRKDLISTMQLSPDTPDDQVASLSDVWRYTSKPLLLFNITSLIFGFVGGVAASVSAVAQLVGTEIAPPCYVQWITTGLGMTTPTGGSTHCCGPYMNTTVFNVNSYEFCSRPLLS
uniref:Aa_trans domain-containing protein n=1 Tax=Heterorhabditis bacteriophora TaxID=37862 RepID=A0A1I7XE62_HETBA